MGCPRCGGSLERFALGDSQSVNCERCGWVGIDVDLGHKKRDPPTDSWDEAVAGGAGEHADEQARVTAGETADIHDPPLDDDDVSSEESAAPGVDLDALLDIDADDAEQLRTTGIRTVDDLAISDPRRLADEVGLPEHRLRTYVRRASIQLATGGAE